MVYTTAKKDYLIKHPHLRLLEKKGDKVTLALPSDDKILNNKYRDSIKKMLRAIYGYRCIKCSTDDYFLTIIRFR